MKSKKEIFDCRAAGELLVPFLDGEASLEESANLEAHLRSCARCTRDIETHRRIGAALSSCGLATREFKGVRADEIRAKEPHEAHQTKAHQTRRRGTYALLSLAALALVACTLVLLSSGERESAEPTDDLLGTLDILEAFEEEGLEPTQEVVQLLLDAEEAEELHPTSGDVFDPTLLELLLEETTDFGNL